MRFSPLLLAGAMAISGGCFLGKKPAITNPVPLPSPAASVPAPTAPPPSVPVPESAPATPTVTETAKPSPFPPVTTLPPPKKPPTRPKPAPASAPAPATAPALGTILTANQRKQLDTNYQADVKESNAVLNGLAGRQLTASQADSVARARAFLNQAAQYRPTDITTAAELAHRARVLTQTLTGK